MKTIITKTAIALALTASVASAQTDPFSSSTLGDSGTFGAECWFQSSNNNTMTRDGDTWNTSAVAANGSINVKMRGDTSLTVINDGILRWEGGAAVSAFGGGNINMTHDYSDGGLSSVATGGSGTSSVSAANITADNTPSGNHEYYDYTINIGGASVMTTDSGDFPRWSLNGNTTYRLDHTASCTQ